MNQGNVLLVDDEEQIIKQYNRALKREGYIVDTAYSGEKGWDKYQQRYYDVVIVDWKMGKMSGMDLLEKIDDKHPAAKVIMITAFADEDSAIEAHHRHAFDYLKKPVKMKLLLEKVAEAVKRKDGVIAALEDWVVEYPEEAARPEEAIFSPSGDTKIWSAKDILDAIKSNSPEGQDEYKKIIKLTIDLLTRGRIK